MNRLISVIIPSYNRLPYLKLTLEGLQIQSLSRKQWEVIVIDDGSQDGTSREIEESIQHYKFPIEIISLKQNKGRAYARNLGAAKSTGDILLFLDAEVIPGPNLLQQHVQLHQLHAPQDMVVSGIASTYSIYSWVFPDQTLQLQETELMRLHDRKGADVPICLINEEDIKNGSFDQTTTSVKFRSLRKIVRAFGPYLKGFHYPWRSSITAQLSVPKTSFDKIGGFDESFQGWGFEDLDMGYRLMQGGAAFICPKHTFAYHQEHPFEINERHSQKRENYTRFVSKHGRNEDWKITMYSARLFMGCSLLSINLLAEEWEEVMKNEQLNVVAVYPVIRDFLLQWTIDPNEKNVLREGNGRKKLKKFRKSLGEIGYFPVLAKLTDEILSYSA